MALTPADGWSADGWSADTGSRLLGGLTAFALTLLPVRGGGVAAGEASVFRLVNGLPDWLHPPAWLVMQLGSLGAVPITAAMAVLTDQPRLAARLAVSGGSTYVLAKGVKRLVRRGRPVELLADVHIRGRAASGHGYLSGHAAVATALAEAARRSLLRPAGRTTLAAPPAVALARLYVGAHLPWDVAGGLALGWTVDAVVGAAMPGRRAVPGQILRRRGTGTCGRLD